MASKPQIKPKDPATIQQQQAESKLNQSVGLNSSTNKSSMLNNQTPSANKQSLKSNMKEPSSVQNQQPTGPRLKASALA